MQQRDHRRIRHLVGTIGVAILAAGSLATSSAQAATPVGDGGRTPCVGGAASSAARTTGEARDPNTVSARQARRLDTQLADRVAQVTSSQLTADERRTRTRVPVAVHVLAPNARTTPLGPTGIDAQITILNRAYAGRQQGATTQTPFRFRLDSSDLTVNRRWYHSDYGTAAERNMKRALHVGDASVLNLYVVSPPEQSGTLGWATFPQAYPKHPRLDGVVISVATVRGGTATGYDRGDTAVHEVGHWLGLFHTFQGGCSRRNDRVTDTPAEDTPQFECQSGRDTCASPGKDPIHNFMDYSYDLCMYTFSDGQEERMRLHWLAYRG